MRKSPNCFPIPTFNESVVREAILNAVSHRNYQLAGSVFIRQFPDRLVIESPGGLPNGISLDNILDRQIPRNRRIAEILALCGLVERSGQGRYIHFWGFSECEHVDRRAFSLPWLSHIAGTIPGKTLMITPVGTGMRSQGLAATGQVLIVHWSAPFVFAVSSLRAPVRWQRAHSAVYDGQFHAWLQPVPLEVIWASPVGCQA